jgi:7-cyano-7-deazaguanine synthase
VPGALVIFSGGLDSTTCLAIAKKKHENVVVLTFDYGQKHIKEVDAAAEICRHYGVRQFKIKFDARQWGGSALTGDGAEIPANRRIDNQIPVTYVPARNIIFLSFGLAVAEAQELDFIYIGVNALDYSGYPDCRPEFIHAFQKVADIGQKRGVEGSPVNIVTPLINMTKSGIVKKAVELNAPIEMTWSCYMGEDKPCGVCDSCILRAKGFQEARFEDPALLS